MLVFRVEIEVEVEGVAVDEEDEGHMLCRIIKRKGRKVDGFEVGWTTFSLVSSKVKGRTLFWIFE